MIEGELRDYVGHRIKGGDIKGTITALKYSEELGETIFVITQDKTKEEIEIPTRASKLKEKGLKLF